MATQRLDLALAYFEKAIGNVITAKGDKTSDLVSLYEEIALIEQLRKNHGQVMQCWQQVGGLAGAWLGGLIWLQAQFPKSEKLGKSQSGGGLLFILTSLFSRVTQESFLNFDSGRDTDSGWVGGLWNLI